MQVAAVTLAAASVFTVLRVVVAAHGQIGGLVVAGSDFVAPSRYTHGVPIQAGSGYDGQFYYRLALDPLDWSARAFGIRLDTLGRLDRVAYPTIVWLASAGQRAAVPVMMVLVNLAALTVLAGVGADLARRAGRYPAWGLVFAGFFGFLWSLGRDLTEITEAVFLMAGLLAVRAGRPIVAGALLGVAVLAREPALIIVGALFLSRAWKVARHRGRAPGRDDSAWAIPVAVFVAWQLAASAGTGSVPVRTSGGNNAGLPFVGLADGWAHYLDRLPQAASLLWFGELAVLLLLGTGALLSWRSTTAPLHERIAWIAIAVLTLCLNKSIWLGDVGFRSLDDFYVLSALLLLSSRSRLGLPGLVVGTAWCVVALELVLFI